MKRFIFAAAISIILLIFLLSQINIHEIFHIILKIDIISLLLGILFYFLQYIGRVLRFSFILLNDSPKILLIFNIVCIHNFLNHILPARIGESSYIVLMNRYGKVPLMNCFSSLLIARILDLVSIISIFSISLVTISSLRSDGYLLETVCFAFFIVAFMGSILYFIKPITETVLQLAEKSMKCFTPSPPSWFTWIGNKMKSLAIEFGIVQNKKNFMLLNIISLFIWASNVGMFYILLKGFGFNIHFVTVALGSTGAALTNILPINGFGSFGTLEAGWALAFVCVGLDKAMAISSGFGIHVVAFLYATLLALFGYIAMFGISFKRNLKSIGLGSID